MAVGGQPTPVGRPPALVDGPGRLALMYTEADPGPGQGSGLGIPFKRQLPDSRTPGPRQCTGDRNYHVGPPQGSGTATLFPLLLCVPIGWGGWLDVDPEPPPPLRSNKDKLNKDARMPDCGVHYLWFAFVCFSIRSHTPPPE